MIGLGKHAAPRIDDERVAIGLAAILVNAALRGEGVVLGSRTLLGRELETRALVQISDVTTVTGLGYYVGTPKSGRITPAARRLASWLVEEAKPTGPTPTA